MLNRGFLGNHLRLALIVTFCFYFWRFFDPTAYSPLNAHEMQLTAWCSIALLLPLAFARGREAFVISLYLMAPIKLLADLTYLGLVLAPTARLYDNWPQFVLRELIWSAPFYLLLVWLWFRTPERGLGLLGLVACLWVLPVALLTEGLQFLMIGGMKVFEDRNYRDNALEDLAITILFCLVLARFLWPPRSRLGSGNVQFDGKGSHELHSLIQGVAEAIRMEVYPRICLSALPNLSIDMDGERLGLGGKPVLVIGLPMLAVLSRANFRSLIAHEFAHFSRRHLSLHRVIYRTLLALSHFPSLILPRRRTATELAATAARYWLYGPLLLPVAVWLRKAMRPVRKSFELEADLEAARITGNANVIDALKEATAATLCYLRRNGGAAPAPSLWEPGEFSQFREFWFSRQGQIEKLEILNEQQNAPVRPGDDYPSLRDRILALQNAASPEVETAQVDGNEPAYLLFADSLPSLQQEFAAHLRRPAPLSSVDLVLRGARVIQGMAVLPVPAILPRSDEPAPAVSAPGKWGAWADEWSRAAWHRVAISVCLALLALTAIFWVEHRIVNSVDAQRYALEAERRVTEARLEFDRSPGAESRYAAELSRAAATFYKSIAMNPNYARAYNDLGYVLEITAQSNEELLRAIRQYEHAIQLNPQYPLAYLNLGRARYSQKEFAGAIESFRNAARLDHGTGSPEHSLGVVYRTLYKVTGNDRDLETAKNYFCTATARPHVDEKLRDRWNRDCENPGELH